MKKSEAYAIIRKHNKARRELIKYGDALWTTSFSSPAYDLYKKKLEKAKNELADTFEINKKAVSVILTNMHCSTITA